MKKYHPALASSFETDFWVLYGEEEENDALKITRTFRDKGFSAKMTPKKDLKNQIIEAQQQNIKEIIVFKEYRLERIDLISDEVFMVDPETFMKSLDNKEDQFTEVSIH
jgi:histidyl-tRNA synthetase